MAEPQRTNAAGASMAERRRVAALCQRLLSDGPAALLLEGLRGIISDEIGKALRSDT